MLDDGAVGETGQDLIVHQVDGSGSGRHLEFKELCHLSVSLQLMDNDLLVGSASYYELVCVIVWIGADIDARDHLAVDILVNFY